MGVKGPEIGSRMVIPGGRFRMRTLRELWWKEMIASRTIGRMDFSIRCVKADWPIM